MAKQPKKKQRPSWFQKQVERDGEDFLLRRQPLSIQKEAFNIVRDIARGNVTPRDFKYLFNLTILSNIRIEVYKKYIEYHTYNSAISLSLQMSNGVQILRTNYGVDENNLQSIYNNTTNILTAYSLVLQSIDTMLAAIQFTYNSEEDRQRNYLQVYSSIQYQLSRFKFIL